MSGDDVKKMGDAEDSLGLAKSEISEVTITEYRKNQIVRMGECVIGVGLIAVAASHRKQLPKWLSISLGVVGAGMTIYNGRNLYMNFKQDGKLIREAIKTKKNEEKKIREELKKSNTKSPENNTEKKSETKQDTKNPTEKIYTNPKNGSDVVLTKTTEIKQGEVAISQAEKMQGEAVVVSISPKSSPSSVEISATK